MAYVIEIYKENEIPKAMQLEIEIFMQTEQFNPEHFRFTKMVQYYDDCTIEVSYEYVGNCDQSLVIEFDHTGTCIVTHEFDED